MSAMSRSKGQSGEREVATLLTQLTGHDVRRRVRQHDGDSDLDGLPGWSIEVKRYASVTPGRIAGEWWPQALAQARAAGNRPVLFYRADRGGWHAVWCAGLLAGVMHRPDAYENTLTASPSTWWAMCKGIRIQPVAATLRSC
jgi:hypothetical protein